MFRCNPLFYHGLIHQTTCLDNPHQNGVAQSKNRTLLDKTRTMMIESRVPSHYWPEAIATANYLSNHLPTKSLNYATPFDTLQTHTHVPLTHSLPPCVFGCVVYVHLSKRSRHKLEPRAIKCVFVGYGVHQKGYLCLDPVTNHLYTTIDYDFVEIKIFFHHLRSQGENKLHDLSCLTYLVLETDQNEQVGKATEMIDHMECNKIRLFSQGPCLRIFR